jgi:hypothetical protein
LIAGHRLSCACPQNIFSTFSWSSQLQFLGRFALHKLIQLFETFGRGSWTRTNEICKPGETVLFGYIGRSGGGPVQTLLLVREATGDLITDVSQRAAR